MNKVIPVLAVLCSFLLGVVIGPRLWPQHLLTSVANPLSALTEPAAPTPSTAEPPVDTIALETAAEPEMQLKGVFVVADGTSSVALIKSGDWQPQPYRVDQKLPNGYVVKSIDKNSVDVEKDGQSVTLSLVRASREAEPEPEATESDIPAAAQNESVETAATEAQSADNVAEKNPAAETGN